MSLSSAQESKALEHMQFLRYYHECSFLHPLKNIHVHKLFPLLLQKQIFTKELLWLHDPSCGWCRLDLNERPLLKSHRSTARESGAHNLSSSRQALAQVDVVGGGASTTLTLEILSNCGGPGHRCVGRLARRLQDVLHPAHVGSGHRHLDLHRASSSALEGAGRKCENLGGSSLTCACHSDRSTFRGCGV